MPNRATTARFGLGALGLVLALGLVACSSGSKKPQPAELAPINALLSARQAWTAQIGAPVRAPLAPIVREGRVFVAGSDGSVLALDGRNGAVLWRVNVGAPLAAGVGSDGERVAVVTQGNELVVVAAGAELWRTRMPAKTFTAPLVAGRRVFVLSADRSLSAFDAQNGARLWAQSRPAESLALQQAGILMAFGDTLVAGQSGRLVGLNPGNGSVRWDASVASSRGTNEIERLVDLVAGVARTDDRLCVRAFQSAVGCVNTARGTLTWSRNADGAVGVDGDGERLYGAESTGRVLAWRLSDGEPAWSTDRLLHRGLTGPLAAGRSVAFGDAFGFVHLLSREDGTVLNRLATDGSAIVAAPVLAGNTLVAVTRNGGVYAWRPE